MAAVSTSSDPEQSQAAVQALLNGPAAPPPVGVTPNFENPPNLTRIAFPLLTIFSIISTLAVLVRTYTKLYLIRSTAYEDYVILLAWASEMSFLVPSILDNKVGGGTHMWDLRLKDFFRLLYWINVSAILYGIIVFLIKLSILLQYLRIFVPSRKGNELLFVAIQTLIWSSFIFYFVESIFAVVICTPREKIWNPLMTTGYCFDGDATYMASGMFNVVSDFAILILPILPILRLQLPLKRKLMMLAVFATGACGCMTSILRTYYTWKVVESTDASFNFVVVGLWTWAEMTSGILVSCLPVTPRFFQHLGSKFSSSLTYRFAPGSNIGVNTETTGSKNKEGFNKQFKRHLNQSPTSIKNSNTYNNTYQSQVPQYGEYITLGEYDKTMPIGSANSERKLLPTRSHSTEQDDLEVGKDALWN